MLLLASVLGCGAAPEAAPKVPKKMPITLPPFSDPNIEVLYKKTARWAESRGWSPQSLRRAGTELSRSWLLGTPGPRSPPPRGSGRSELGVYAYGSAEYSFGMSWFAIQTDENGRTASVGWSYGGRKTASDYVGFSVTPPGSETMGFGPPMSWTVGESTFRTERPQGFEDTMARVATIASGGDALRSLAAADLDALEELVWPVLIASDFSVCDPTPSPGRGIPGPCIRRAPTESEVKKESSLFDAEVTRRRAVLEDLASWADLLAALAPP